VAYLVSQYPKLSHAFIETEVRALRDLGVEVQTFSVRAADDAELLSEGARDEAARTTALLEGAGRTLPRALAALVGRSPGALLAAARTAARSGPRSPRGRLWQLFYLCEAVVLWWRMSRAGLRHVHVHFANNSADVARLTVALGTAVDGPAGGWRWSLSMHGPTEFEDRTAFDLAAKVASASAVACISDYCRSQVLRLLPPSDWAKVGIARMSVDCSRFRPPEPGPVPDGSGGAGPFRVLTVGRLVPEKGAPVLLDAVARLRDAGVPVELTVVGAGPLHDELVAEVASRSLSGLVHLAGAVGQQALPDLYGAADVFCLPSFAEGLPVVLMEAMASGRPVVTTAIAGIPELVVHRHTGLVVPAGRPDLIAGALAELAADPELRRRLAGAARAAVVEAHQSEANARQLVALWEATGPTAHQPGRPAAVPAGASPVPARDVARTSAV
jgi:glycosyltransferase involved in cell wall biosynthesis